MDTRWFADFKALRTVFPVAVASSSYDHDAVSDEELDELHSGVEASSPAPVINGLVPDKLPVVAAEQHVAPSRTGAREESPSVEIPRSDITVEEGPVDIPGVDEAWLGAGT